MRNTATTRKTWRTWLLLAVACWGCVAPTAALTPNPKPQRQTPFGSTFGSSVRFVQMKFFASLLCILLTLTGCARQPDWKALGVLRVSEITPASYENPFITRAIELELVASRLSLNDREEFRARATLISDAARDHRARLSKSWVSFTALKKDGERLFRCELLEDQYFVIEERGSIVAKLWMGPTNHAERIGEITFPKK